MLHSVPREIRLDKNVRKFLTQRTSEAKRGETESTVIHADVPCRNFSRNTFGDTFKKSGCN